MSKKKEQATKREQGDTTKDLTDEQLQTMSGGAQTFEVRMKADGTDIKGFTSTGQDSAVRAKDPTQAEDDVIVDGQIVTAQDYDS